MREDKFTNRKQQGISVPNPDSINPEKSFISDKYNSQTEIKRKKYLAKELMKVGDRGFS